MKNNTIHRKIRDRLIIIIKSFQGESWAIPTKPRINGATPVFLDSVREERIRETAPDRPTYWERVLDPTYYEQLPWELTMNHYLLSFISFFGMCIMGCVATPADKNEPEASMEYGREEIYYVRANDLYWAYDKRTKKPITGVYRTYHRNGNLWKEIWYRNGLKHGEERGFYTNGQIKHLYHHSKGKEQWGDKTVWHENGQLAMHVPIQKGKANGISRKWNGEGELMREILWEDDELIETLLDKYTQPSKPYKKQPMPKINFPPNIKDRLSSYYIEGVDFKEADIGEVIRYMHGELFNQTGIFLVMTSTRDQPNKITLKKEKISVFDLIDEACRQAKIKWTWQGNEEIGSILVFDPDEYEENK